MCSQVLFHFFYANSSGSQGVHPSTIPSGKVAEYTESHCSSMKSKVLAKNKFGVGFTLISRVYNLCSQCIY